MKQLLLLIILLPITAFTQVSYTVTVLRLKAKADDCDGGIVTFCGNAPQDPIFNLWSNDAEANEHTSCWIFDDDPEAEYNLWKDIQNLEIANESNVLTSYISFDMAGYESDNLNPGCTSSFGDDAIHDRQFVQQIDLANLIEGGTDNIMELNLNDVYYAEIAITWIDLTASISTLSNSEIRISPNPSNGNFQVRTVGMTGERRVEIRDMSGRLVHQLTTLEDVAEVQLESLSSGTYLVHVSSENGEAIEKITVF